MTTRIIPHQCDYGRVARRRRALPKFVDNRPNTIRISAKLWKIGQMLHQTKTDLEKGAAHAILTLPNKAIWGISIKTSYGKDYNSTGEIDIHGSLISVPNKYNVSAQKWFGLFEQFG